MGVGRSPLPSTDAGAGHPRQVFWTKPVFKLNQPDIRSVFASIAILYSVAMLTQYTTLSFCTKQTQSLYDDYDVLCTTSAAEPAQRRHSGRATACRKTKWTGRYNAIATADSRPCVRGSDTQHTPCSSEKTKSTPHAGHPANISADRSADGERRSLAKYYDVFGPTCQQRLFRNQH